jgi:hypothetical protein
MKAKLTLKLDQMAINSVKKYAESNNRSLPKATENYFEEGYPPLIKKLSGIISENDLKRLSECDDRVKYILREEA